MNCSTALIIVLYSGLLDAKIICHLRKAGVPETRKQLSLALKNYSYPHEKLPLHVYASVGEIHHVALIIQHAIAENKTVSLVVNAPDEQGKTPLHHTCMGNHIQVVRLLLSHNASSCIVDHHGKTPRDIAEEMKLDEIIQLFDTLKN